MTVTVKNKEEPVVPLSVRRRAGIKSGDRLEFRVSGGVIRIMPKLPSADDEYTSAQRKVIDARLAESEGEFKEGRGFGPFDTAEAMIVHMKAQLKKAAAAKKPKNRG